MSNPTNTIEAGAIVRMDYGAMYGEEFGILVESRTNEWGTQYKILKDDGEVTWTSEIMNPGDSSPNGSQIGCFLVE